MKKRVGASLLMLSLMVFAMLPALVGHAAPEGTLGRIRVYRYLHGSGWFWTTVYDNGWQNQTVYFDNQYAVNVEVTTYSSDPPWDFRLTQVSGSSDYDESVVSSSVTEDFWPWPPIDGGYRAYVDGNTPGTFYLRARYPDLVPSKPRPNDGAASPPFCVGDPIDWYVTITNEGAGTSGSTDMEYYLGSSPSDFSHYIDDDSVSGLDPGESTVESDLYTFVDGDVGTSRYLNVVVDSDDDEEEEDEDNTEYYGPFEVKSAPGAVGLLSPANGGDVCSGAPTFTWSAYTGATRYNIQIDNNADFTSPERNVFVTGTSYVPSPALSQGTWYWRVSAENECDLGVWSSHWTLDVMSSPNPPGLLTPLASESTCDTTPDFAWSSVWDANQYRFQLDDSPDFSSPIHNFVQPGTSFTPSTPLNPGTYYWQVRSENGCGESDYATYRQFTIGAPPDTPSHSSPGNATALCSLLPTFVWSSLPEASSYYIQVDDDSDFTSPEIDDTTLATSYTPASPLPAGPIYWRVAAHGTCGDSLWSSPWTVELMQAPPAPSLLSPDAGADLCTLAPSFSWSPSFQAEQYNFQLASDIGFNDLVLDEWLPGLSYDASSLGAGSYYWHARGQNQCGDGPWSSPVRQVSLHNPVVLAGFEGTPVSGTIPLPVSFTSLAQGEIDDWLWDFGDGETSTDISPTHIYTIEGSFDVNLSVSGFCGSDAELKPNYVETIDAPILISQQRVSNIRDTTFTVSWLTDLSSNGYVEYGTTTALGQVADDVRGSLHSGYTHYAQVTGLEPETTYYFDLISGSSRDDNGGAHYTVTTGPVLSPPEPNTAYGLVYQDDGTTPAEGAIVFITLSDSDGSGDSGSAALLSSLVDEYGYWYTTLSNARLPDLSAYFQYSLSGDTLYLEATGGPLGDTCLYEDTGTDYPSDDMVLGDPCVSDEPLEGLQATNDGPTWPGDITTLSATVSAGTNVAYTWDLGDDGQLASGQVVTHTYPDSGVYTAVVTASNSLGFMTATTPITILSAVDSYLNHFTDLEGWILGEGLFTVRCGEPILQTDSIVYANSSDQAGYVELPMPLISSADQPMIVEVRYRYNDNGGLVIGMTKNRDHICEHYHLNDGFALGFVGEGTDRVHFSVSEVEEISALRTWDNDWHIVRLIRDVDGYWSMYIDDVLLGTSPYPDTFTHYRYLSVQAYASASGVAEIDYILVEAGANGVLNLSVDLQGRADDSGALFTAWSGGEQAGSCMSASDGACSIDLPTGVYSVTAEMASYLDGVWDSASVSAGSTTTLPTVKLLGGDVNEDCVINILDLTPMGSHFGTECGDPDWAPATDINGDCLLNILDLTIVGGNFGSVCPVPWAAALADRAPTPASAQVLLDPVELDLQLGNTGVMDISVTGAIDLYGAQATLTFDPAVVEVVDADDETPGVQVALGDLLQPDFVALNSVDNTAGTIEFALTQLSPTPPSDGDGVLATITFRGLVEGTSDVAFEEMILADSDGAQIQADASGGTIQVGDDYDYMIYLPLVLR